MLLVDALYVNNSGGKVLLDYLIHKLVEHKIEVFFVLDKRCEESYLDLKLKNAIFVEATLKNREKIYKNDNEKFTHFFCFANLAPPVKCNGKVVTYFHNLLLSEIPVGTPLKKRMLLLLKRYFAKKVSNNSDLFVVQTEYAKQSFKKAYGNRPVSVIPFYNDFQITPGAKQAKSFLYVSDGNPHKNHMRLFKAWRAVKDSDAELWLTVSNAYPEVVVEILQLQKEGFKVVNFQNQSRTALNALYAKAEYLLYPSLLESFGLGLIEGALGGCKIIASDLSYVYQVVEPSKVFDPYDVDALASCISQLNENEQVPNTILKAKDGIDQLIEIISKKK